ncbi:MAG TPA: pyrimidine-nucleoside phosphorylase [Bacillota bacterium]|nr:pyrimidine-nucleoside phosphorylase [Bacillota bacterium]
MRAVDIIIKKRNGQALSRGEIEFFIEGYIGGEIPDYQASALMMAIYFKGMDRRETADLTMAMVNSGDRIDLSEIGGIKTDKHSTGGVGDTTTLIVVPLVAACGVPVAKMSGRGLGHTGGTLDKLESIPGFNTNLSKQEFIGAVKSTGLAVIGQSQGLVPADRLLYALRDVTGTVASLPLIASSIMSKKIASGADAIVLDVKTGSGAFMETSEDSFALAQEMIAIGDRLGINTTALVTDMNQPLGMSVGNALEVIEAIQVLRGEINSPLKDVSLLLTSYMLYTAGACEDIGEGEQMARQALESGRGLAKLELMIREQGGNAGVIEDINLMPKAGSIIPVKADMGGYISSIDTEKVGISSLILGAGRTKKDAAIDPAVGLVMHKRVGDRIGAGESLADFHINSQATFKEACQVFKDAISIGNQEPSRRPLVYGAVTLKGIERFKW